jgi:hypothetical protein
MSRPSCDEYDARSKRQTLNEKMSNTTDNVIDDAACDQLLEWFRLPVPLELKANLRARVLLRRINRISSGPLERAPDRAMACGSPTGHG